MLAIIRRKLKVTINRDGHSTDPKADAALQFAYRIATSRGHIEDADVEAVRAAGYTEEQIMDIVAEIVAETAFSFITNLFNNTFKTDIDATFPPLRTRARKAA